MSVFRRIEREDILSSVLVASPTISVVSGTGGWRGTAGVSSSMPAYGDLRGRTTNVSIVPSLQADTHTPEALSLFSSGSYPATASIRLVTMRDEELATPTQTRWGQEHLRPILNLYEHYSRLNPDYTTRSLDYYCLYFAANTVNVAVGSSGSNLEPTGSFTIEARVKLLTSSMASYTICSKHDQFHFYVSGSALNGTAARLVFSSSNGIVSSSVGVSTGSWTHVAVRRNLSTSSGSFLVDLKDAGAFFLSATLNPQSTRPFSVGARFTASAVLVSNSATGRDPLHGFLREARVWGAHRSDAQLSSSFDRVLHGSSSVDLLGYWRFNDGPIRTGLTDFTGSVITVGSGAKDYSNNSNALFLGGYSGNNQPTWLPCDDVSFVADRSYIEDAPSVFRVVNIPRIFYGRRIATGSVEIEDRSYSSTSRRLIRIIRDNGRGGLYVSGSMLSSSLHERASYRGVEWRLIGNVFYDEGLIVIKDPAMLDLGDDGTAASTAHASSRLSLTFRGVHRVPTLHVSCRMPPGELNASNNTSFSRVDTHLGRTVRVREDDVTYVTAVGIYDERHRLVGVAKLAQPIRKRPRDGLNVRVKIDL